MENEFEGVSSLPKLKDVATYLMWQFQINILLKSCGLYKVATGEEKCPENDKEEWKQKDAKVKKIILCTVEQNIWTHIIMCEDGFGMLKCLKNWFETEGIKEIKYIEMIEEIEAMSSLPKLKDAETYLTWQLHINTLLKYFKIASGEEKCPENDREEWEQKDAKVKILILCSVEENILTHILMCKDGFGMLKCLKNLFETKSDNDDQKLTVLLKFYNWKWDMSKNGAYNLTDINGIVNELKILNEDVTKAMLTAKFLTVLPKNVLTAWKSTPKEDRTIENLISKMTLGIKDEPKEVDDYVEDSGSSSD